VVNLTVFLAVLSASAAAFFYTAQDARGGMSAWANQACSMANALCLHPEWPAMAAVVLFGVAVVLKIAGASRG
jgi:hypothetical protein